VSRIVVVDDHPIFRKGLVALLRASGHDVVGEASDGLEAVAVVLAEDPDVVLMDLGLPGLGGIEATARITAERPGVRVVVITLFDDEASVRRALEAGAQAYVVKQASPDHILNAIDAALAGVRWLGTGVPLPGFGTPERDAIPGLTPREAAVADLLARGLANPAIAERLGLSTKTVANYVSTVLLKIGVEDRVEAARVIRAARDR
jgi:DNA-binding NarL/FixJ family response regulator